MASHKHPMAKWQAIRKQGFLRFILIRGALLWGICSAVFFSLMMLFMTDLPLASLLPKALLLFSLSGLVWGAIMWWVLERKYQQHMTRSAS